MADGIVIRQHELDKMARNIADIVTKSVCMHLDATHTSRGVMMQNSVADTATFDAAAPKLRMFPPSCVDEMDEEVHDTDMSVTRISTDELVHSTSRVAWDNAHPPIAPPSQTYPIPRPSDLPNLRSAATMRTTRSSTFFLRAEVGTKDNWSMTSNLDFNIDRQNGPKTLHDRLRGFVTSSSFELVSISTILLNTLYNGVEVHILSTANPSAELQTCLDAVGSLFNIVFLVELLLRLDGHGLWQVFSGSDRWWMRFDAIIVLLGVVETFLLLAGSGQQMNANLVRAVRIMKIARVLRVVRVFHSFRGLRIVLLSLIHTVKNSFWVLLVLCLILWTMGTIFTFAGIEGHKQSAAHPDLDKFYGTLFKSIYTLYAAVFGGIDWNDAVEPLHNLENTSVWITIFMFYISTQYLCIVNVITGVFCQGAMESAVKDHDMVIAELLSKKKEYINELNKLWTQLDKDGSGSLTLDEFEDALQEESVRAYLEGLGITATDAWTLFSLLEDPATKTLQPATFLEGCLKINGSARAVDIAALGKDLKSDIYQLIDAMQDVPDRLNKLETAMMSAQKRRKS
eukprot:TRINITY_DN34355_c0_g1_i1.p1 TRINITY_DN34355_c0_g1~~TRINITY_DN34355_c0_g1_i1.p1  ORF type:complete len:569 (-),score=84.46 TRINITY_DN34355_c0_g1_i1:97-1803(-)